MILFSSQIDYAFSGVSPLHTPRSEQAPAPALSAETVREMAGRDSLLTPGMIQRAYGGLANAFPPAEAGVVVAAGGTLRESASGDPGASLGADADARRRAMKQRGVSLASSDIMDAL